MTDTERFLAALFEGKPKATAIQIWHRISARDSKTHYHDDIGGCSRGIEGLDSYDVYVAAGLAPKVLRPSRTRMKANEVVGIPGVWADIDVNGGPEGKTDAAPSAEAAVDLSRALLEPTVIVNSGYGIQAWWLWDEGPWMFGTIDEREHAARIVRSFQGALRAEARRRGFGLDSTVDLARVLRVPGTFNHKGGLRAPVELLESEGNRYSVEDVAELSHGLSVALSETSMDLLSGKGVEFTLSSDPAPPVGRLEQALEFDEGFADVWKQKPRGKKNENWTHSEWEMSLTNHLVEFGWTDQEIADTLCYYRNKYQQGDPKGKNRRDRIATTIGKARARRTTEAVARQIEMEREDAADQLEAMGAVMGAVSIEADPVRTVSLFNRVIGGPEIAQLRQNSVEPGMARFTLLMADGQEVHLGPIENLTNQQKFRDIYATITQHYPMPIKTPKWAAAVHSLLKSAVVFDEPGDGRQAIVLRWVAQYLGRNASSDRHGACRRCDPFIRTTWCSSTRRPSTST